MTTSAPSSAVGSTANGTNDVVLLTIDCWRHDAIEHMPNLRAEMDGGVVRTDAIAPSSKTRYVSPALLQSRLFSDVLNDDGGDVLTRYSVVDDVPSLPEVLSEHGYSTAAFIAANPYLRHYEDHFEVFWDGIDDSDRSDFAETLHNYSNRVVRTLLLRKSVSATELGRKAREWYRGTDGPRFLWMHLMEPHYPYYPGLGYGSDVGLVRSFKASVNRFRTSDTSELSRRDVRTLRQLYWACVRRLDDQLPDLLEIPDDDALLVVTGDHGEGFEHGRINHHDLYDECIRVPFLLFNGQRSAYDGGAIRQLDVPPTILDEQGIAPPECWEGVSLGRDPPSEAVLLTLSTSRPRPIVSVGLRTEEYKLIRRYNTRTGEFEDSELYDLGADPRESRDISDTVAVPELEERLAERLAERDVLENLTRINESEPAEGRSDVDDGVERRLQELGYR